MKKFFLACSALCLLGTLSACVSEQYSWNVSALVVKAPITVKDVDNKSTVIPTGTYTMQIIAELDGAKPVDVILNLPINGKETSIKMPALKPIDVNGLSLTADQIGQSFGITSDVKETKTPTGIEQSGSEACTFYGSSHEECSPNWVPEHCETDLFTPNPDPNSLSAFGTKCTPGYYDAPTCTQVQDTFQGHRDVTFTPILDETVTTFSFVDAASNANLAQSVADEKENTKNYAKTGLCFIDGQ